MAKDYLAIPGSTCIAERSFSLSGRTDKAHWQQMNPERFGAIQRLHGAYRDGRLETYQEALLEIGPDFND